MHKVYVFFMSPLTYNFYLLMVTNQEDLWWCIFVIQLIFLRILYGLNIFKCLLILCIFCECIWKKWPIINKIIYFIVIKYLVFLYIWIVNLFYEFLLISPPILSPYHSIIFLCFADVFVYDFSLASLFSSSIFNIALLLYLLWFYTYQILF